MTNIKIIILLILVCLLSFFLLGYGEAGLVYDQTIFWQLRIPKVVVALLSGGILATSGLLMQIFFENPLASPDILGVSAGSSLFVAIWIMGASIFPEVMYKIGASVLSLLGAFSVFGILLFFLYKKFNRFSLLIVGLLISTFSSSGISFLMNISSSLQMKNYLVWTLGSFRNVTLEDLPLFVLMAIISISPLFLLPKALNQFQLGEKYAQSMGLNISKIKKILITTCAFSISTVTLFCGPVGFIGIIAPHIARFFLKSSNMSKVLPVTFLFGSLLALLAESFLVVTPSWSLSVNTILGFFGAPVIIIYLYRQRSWVQ